MFVVKLAKPIAVGEGDAKKTLQEIDLTRIDNLTGAELLQCERDAAAIKGELVRVLALDHEFHVQVAAAASGVAVADLKRLGARDFVEVLSVVQGFLTGTLSI